MNLAVTYFCNARCRMCNVWQNNKNNFEKIQSELTIRDYDIFFRELSSDILWITLTGGEPFLRRDIVEIINSANNNLKNLKIIELTTNGLNPKLIIKKTREIIKISPDKYISLAISLDGKPAIHNYMRGRQDAWEKTTQTFINLKKLAKAYDNIRIHLSYTITSYNAGEFEDFFEKFRNHLGIKLDDISFAVEHSGSLYLKPKMEETTIAKKLVLNTKFFKDIDFILKNKNKSTGINGLNDVIREIFYTFFLTKVKEYIKNPCKMIIPCKALFTSFFMDPYGNIFPCIIWNRKLGNIRIDNFENIWNSKFADKVREIINERQCPICWTPCEAQASFLTALPVALIR